MQKNNNKYRDTGLLILRLGLGIMFMLHGLPKLSGGMEKWTDLGKSMGHLGIHFWPAFWGFLCAVSEFGGGVMLILGLLTRAAAFCMFFTMLVAFISHYVKTGSVMAGAEAAEDGIVFFSLIFTGAGRFSIDGMLGRR